MPVCASCFNFYVRPQTFETLFSTKKQCIFCETIEKIPLNHEVIPIEGNTLHCFSYLSKDYPILTKKVFETMIQEPLNLVFYEEFWLQKPLIFFLLAHLFNPFNLFDYQGYSNYMHQIFNKSE
ncbi:MAG: hypothetical protein ACLFRI_01680 [Candidatus Izemoplasmataceae bacterium]